MQRYLDGVLLLHNISDATDCWLNRQPVTLLRQKLLGKLYLYGKETERDYSKAEFYLSATAEHGNRYAEQLLHNMKSGSR